MLKATLDRLEFESQSEKQYWLRKSLQEKNAELRALWDVLEQRNLRWKYYVALRRTTPTTYADIQALLS